MRLVVSQAWQNDLDQPGLHSIVVSILAFHSFTTGGGCSSVVEHWATNLWARGSIPTWSMLEGFLILHRHAFVPACPNQPNWCKNTGRKARSFHFISSIWESVAGPRATHLWVQLQIIRKCTRNVSSVSGSIPILPQLRPGFFYFVFYGFFQSWYFRLGRKKTKKKTDLWILSPTW